MKTYIALLRGINVSGHKKILMADLRQLFENLGFQEVQSYIQSGNVIFHSKALATECETLISEAIKIQYGWDVPVLVKTASEIKTILSTCPFSEDKKEKSYFILLQSTPIAENISETNLISYPNEEFVIVDLCVYIYYEKGAGKGKCGTNFFERKLKVGATARNYRTLKKLLDMANK